MQFKWLRRFVRRRTRPIPAQTATDWKKRLSIAYMLIAWNAFGFVCYMMYTGRTDWAKYYGYKTSDDPTPGVYWARSLSKGETKIVRLSGFHKTGEETFKRETETTEDAPSP
ncbi:uncharacterized protein LOC126471946 [Schistocerca serialis cubense]|uniref:uncharacterized protein LOC126471946 n=1 Tax=Schistocerca serialis cubense TaxID=2023355 RepID=UPI00214EFC6F|nr:uncharacterized protein LOC126471946 [Schistocerca serialis cubense]